MNTVTTELMDAKLDVLEARMDARISAIEAAIASLIQSQQELRADFRELRSEFRELRAEFKNLRTTIIVTAIASVLAVGAINATIFSNMLAALDAGRITANEYAEVKRIVERAAAVSERAATVTERAEARQLREAEREKEARPARN